jgi:hypothetical protein
MSDDSSRRFSVRPALESIFLYIAWEAVQDAEAQETDWLVPNTIRRGRAKNARSNDDSHCKPSSGT